MKVMRKRLKNPYFNKIIKNPFSQTILWMNYCFKNSIKIALVNIVTNNDNPL